MKTLTPKYLIAFSIAAIYGPGVARGYLQRESWRRKQRPAQVLVPVISVLKQLC